MVKCCVNVGYVKSQHQDDKSPLIGAWTGSRDSKFSPGMYAPYKNPKPKFFATSVTKHRIEYYGITVTSVSRRQPITIDYRVT